MAQGITRFRLRVDPLLSGPDREVLAFLIIDRILERTASGQNVDGKSFTRYSRGYLENLREIGAPTNVDLQLTGEMLHSIQLLTHGSGFIEIGMPAGSEAARKAGWQQGGNPNIPRREFMGIDDAEAVGMEQQVLDSSPVAQAQRFLNEANVVDRIFESITLGFGNG